MSRQNMTDRASLAQRRIEWINRGPGHAEGDRDSLLLQHKHCGVHRAHPRHGFVSPILLSVERVETESELIGVELLCARGERETLAGRSAIDAVGTVTSGDLTRIQTALSHRPFL